MFVYLRGIIEDAVTDTTGIQLPTHAQVRINMYFVIKNIKRIY